MRIESFDSDGDGVRCMIIVFSLAILLVFSISRIGFLYVVNINHG